MNFFIKSNFALCSSLLFLTMACGTMNEQASKNSSQEKKYVLACDGVAFNNADPFGKRVTFAASGTKIYKAGSFDISKEKDEFFKVASELVKQCNGGYLVINTAVCQINVFNPNLQFNVLQLSVGGFEYKGNYSCNLKEKGH